MNHIFLSPDFPPNLYHFCIQLRKMGANVLGISTEHYDCLNQELKEALTEYYKVEKMDDYDQLLRAVGYFTHRYGKIERIDSFNEYWFEKEACLRLDFNMQGLKPEEIINLRNQNELIKTFRKARCNVPDYIHAPTLKDAKAFIKKSGCPVSVKTDYGFIKTPIISLNNEEELEKFYEQEPPEDYYMEKIIEGEIISFDGLTDQDGNVVFSASHYLSKRVNETLKEKDDFYLYSLTEVPDKIKKTGLRILKAFNVKSGFFHIEFVRTPKDKLFAVDINLTPPGGLMIDLLNYANDIDLYKEWANIIVQNKFQAKPAKKYYVGYISRNYEKDYVHSHEEIMSALKSIVHYQEVDSSLSNLMGSYGYVIKSDNIDEILKAVNFIQKTA